MQSDITRGDGKTMRTDINTMTFGIEIECTIPQDKLHENSWSVGSYHAGCPIPGFDGWKSKYDGSISARYPNAGVEVVSPVLSGAEGLAQVVAMVGKLNEMGATVNRSTGFHVHIGWNGTPEQLRRLVSFVAFHEKALFASTGTTTREQNHFCASIKSTYRPLVNVQSEGEIHNWVRSRYHTLNLQNLSPMGKRTVEFRVFAGTLNLTKIVAYVQLCLGIVQKSLDNPRKPLGWDAPANDRQTRLGVGNGEWAMRTLLTHLHWRKAPRPGRSSAGVIDQTMMPSMLKQLIKLSRQYDGRGRRATPGAR